MKPLKLEMQCFGSFYESCEINFEELSRNRIFLITGRTGSGKTTILDAMCCALYGSATGEGRQWELMRSMIAPENKPTFVNFTFSIGNKLYRFERTMQIKERKRGGEKIKSAETQAAAFEFADGEWSMIAKNPREVQQAAQRLLGFTREQFVQIIILPQGEFKKLLLANSKEKSVILESLFLASRWKDIAGAAALKSRQLNESLLAMRSEYTALLGSFGCLASDDLDKKITESAQNEASLLSDIEKTEGQLSEAEKELEKMRSLSDAFLQLDKWQRTVKELEEKQAQIDSLRCDTEKSEKLLSLLPFFDRMNGALLRHKQQKESSKRLAEQKERAQVFLNARRQKYDALPAMRKQAEEMQLMAKALSEQIEKAKRLDYAKNEHRILLERLEKIKSEEISLTCDLDDARERYKKGEQIWRDTLEQIGRMPELSEGIRHMQSAADDLDRLKKQEHELSRVYQIKLICDENAKKAHAKYDSMRRNAEFLRDMFSQNSAYALSSRLSDGSPCPVCGSAEHPHPAKKPQDSPSAQDVKQAEESASNSFDELQMAVSGQNKAASDYSAVFGLVQELRDRCKKYKESSEYYRAHSGQMQEEYNRLDKMQSQRGIIEERRQKLNSEIKDMENRLALLQSRKLTVSAEERSKQDQIALITESVGGEKTAAQLEDELLRLNEEIKKTEAGLEAVQDGFFKADRELTRISEQLASSRNAEEEKRAAFEEASLEFSGRLKDSGLELREGIFDGLPDREQLDRRKNAVSQFEMQLHTARQNFSDCQLRTKGREKPALHEYLQRKDSLSDRLSQMKISLGRLQSELGNMRSCAERAKNLDRQMVEKDRLYSNVSRISGFLSGKNSFNTPIHQFVLGIMLENIVQYANVYLDRFSRGKYSLVRVDREGGHGYKGMELDVIDSYIGGSRDVKTLSGGEIFITSLSLAFGLSDAVQSFAGGIRVDSLFIDEGFGSLDPETLDTAMRALNDILKSDRIIGLISHVEQLRDSIAARIEVTKSDNGSARIRITA